MPIRPTRPPNRIWPVCRVDFAYETRHHIDGLPRSTIAAYDWAPTSTILRPNAQYLLPFLIHGLPAGTTAFELISGQQVPGCACTIRACIPLPSAAEEGVDALVLITLTYRGTRPWAIPYRINNRSPVLACLAIEAAPREEPADLSLMRRAAENVRLALEAPFNADSPRPTPRAHPSSGSPTP